jgi:serine/threonine protein kinase
MNEPGSQPSTRNFRDAAALPDDALEDPRIFAVVQEYMSQLESGGAPDRAAYVNRFPELSDAVRQCLEGLDFVRSEAPGSQSVAARGRSAGAQQPGIDVPANPLGDFQIIRELARGGMGIVYEAVQLSLGRRVALKVLPFAATLDSRQLQRFKTEAQAAALLHHPNIVPVFAVGCERGVHFYAMQLIDGQSLALLIRQLRKQAGFRAPEDISSASGVHSSYLLGTDEPSESRSALGRAPRAAAAARILPLETVSQFHAHLSTQHAGRNDRFFETVARLMLQAAHALEHAHEFGIVHRDIKPANLLLDARGVLWVTDFGLAQFHADTGITRTGDIPGTLRYMSPEQATGQRGLLDQRSDVYSLGATFYEFLTLEPIFRGRDVQYLLNQILHTEPRGLRQIDKTIPVELETIILKSVSKSPADRYRSAGDLAADLQRYLDHVPILARRPTLVDRVHKWSRRHPSIVVAGMLMLIVIAGGLSYSNYRESLRANEAEKRFQQARQAVDVLIEVSEGELADNWNQGVQATRRRLLGIALGYYQDFIEQRRGDAAAQEKLADVVERVERILSDLKVLQREVPLGLLDKPAVSEALELTKEQEGQVSVLLKKRIAERDAWWEESSNLDEDSLRRRSVKSAERYDRELGEILLPAQLERLKQLAIQSQGVSVFKEPEIVEALNITPEQRRTIRAIEHDTNMKMYASRKPGPGPRDREFRWRPNAAFMDEAVARVVGLFTPDQLRLWKEMTGEVFPEAWSLRFLKPGRPHDRPPETNTPSTDTPRAPPESQPQT